MIVILRMIYRPLCVRNILHVIFLLFDILCVFEVPYPLQLTQFTQMLDMTGIFLNVY